MRIDFIVYGEPQGKSRPKFSNINGKARARTPQKTKEYEENIKASFLEQCGNRKFPEGSQLELNVYAYFKIPKNTSKKKRETMLSEEIRPVKKPDADNILKAVADALNGVCYKDDKCLVKMSAEKFYDEEPKIEIVVQTVE